MVASTSLVTNLKMYMNPIHIVRIVLYRDHYCTWFLAMKRASVFQFHCTFPQEPAAQTHGLGASLSSRDTVKHLGVVKIPNHNCFRSTPRTLANTTPPTTVGSSRWASSSGRTSEATADISSATRGPPRGDRRTTCCTSRTRRRKGEPGRTAATTGSWVAATMGGGKRPRVIIRFPVGCGGSVFLGGGVDGQKRVFETIVKVGLSV